MGTSPTPLPTPTPAKPRVPELLTTIRVRHVVSDIMVNPRTGYVYVGNDDSFGYISIIKGIDWLTALPTGAERSPSQSTVEIAADEARGWVYALNSHASSLVIIQNTEVVTTIQTVGRGPSSVVVEPKSHWAYVVSGYKQYRSASDPVEGNILVLDGPKVIGNINVGRVLLTHVAADPTSGYVYAGGASSEVIVIQGMQEITRHIKTKLIPQAPVRAIDTNVTTGEVYVLDAFGGVRRFKADKYLDNFETGGPNGKGVLAMRVHPKTGDLYIPWGSTQVGRVDVWHNNNKLVELKVGGGPAHMDIDPLTGYVYIANYGSDTVSVISGTEVITNIKVGVYPYGIAVNPTNGWVYVTNNLDNSVSVLGYR
jgi:YVTN family beta-propeller protein